MKIGVLLLDNQDNYLINNELPSRPLFDKTFLVDLCKGFKLNSSKNTYKNLPKSILTNVFDKNYQIHLGINGINNTDLLFITRTKNKDCNINTYKKFRLENFKCILKLENFEIWKNKKYFKGESNEYK